MLAIPPETGGPRAIPSIGRRDATDVGLTSRSFRLNASLDFSPKLALDVRERMGVLNADFDDANREVRPVGVVMNLGDPTDDTGCCILKAGERGDRAEGPTTATGHWCMLELCCCFIG